MNKVLLVGRIGTTTDNSRYNEQLASALKERGIDVTFIPTHPINKELQNRLASSGSWEMVAKGIGSSIDTDRAVILLSAPSTKDSMLIGSETVSYLQYGVSKLPRVWRENLKLFDRVWTFSTYAKGVVEDDIDTLDVKTILPAVDTDEYEGGLPPRGEILEDDNFKFLARGSFGPSAGSDKVLRAFCEEFDSDESVSLYIEAEGEKFYPRVYQMNLPMHAKVQPFNLQVSGEEEAKFFNSFDAYVTADRGSGRDLNLMRAMACELPTIAPDHTFYGDIVSEETTWILRRKGLQQVPAQSIPVSVERGMEWFKPDTNHLKALMREAFESDDEIIEKGLNGREQVEPFTFSDAVDKMEGQL